MHISTTATGSSTTWPSCTPIDGIRCSSCSALPMVVLKSSSSSNSSLFIPRRHQKKFSFAFSFSSSPLKPVLSCCSCSPLAFATHQESSSAFLVTQGPKNETHEISGVDLITTSQNDTNSISSLDDTKDINWIDLEEDLFYWTKPVRPVQWYPGHIAKTEKELKDQLKLMDVVIEVRDARIPLATSHPQMDLWLGNRKKILVLNREDMISSADRNAWATYFARQGVKVIFANGQFGMGTMKLGRLARALALSVNVRRREKGLLPRPVRAGVVGYPNVGKSSLINRLLKRRKCAAAPRPGVTRELKWVHFGSDLELLDSPGILPMRISDQVAAIKLAICDDIGERSYDVCDVAVILVQMLCKLPGVGSKSLYNRYRINTDGSCGRTFLDRLSIHMFGGNVNQAAFRILTDYRKGKFGWFALERPPK